MLGQNGTSPILAPRVFRMRATIRVAVDEDCSPPTGSLEADAPPPVPTERSVRIFRTRSSADVSQHCKSLQLRMWYEKVFGVEGSSAPQDQTKT